MSLISAFPGGGAEIEGNALPANVEKGVTFMSANSDEVQTGTKVPQGTATPSDVVSGKTFQSAASEGLQTGTRSSGTYLFRSGTVTVQSNVNGDTDTTVNIGFYPTYLYVAVLFQVSYENRYLAQGGWWNGTKFGYAGNVDSAPISISKTSTGFTVTYSNNTYDNVRYVAIGT